MASTRPLFAHHRINAAISEDQISEFKEAFSLFDRKGNGHIESANLGDLLRALGQNPTQAKVRELVTEADPSGTGTINFDTFVKVLMRPDGFKPAGTRYEFINGFKVFDKDGSGYIPQGELRYVLTNLGEKLTDAEVDELVKGVDVDSNGRINYEIFVDLILAS
ncbi:hypothetical protein BGZ59_002650 [Podila verticillata]|nr:hypothetical protein BGZ59_002650 [Podila verticillata]